MKRISILFAIGLAVASIGCQGQVPPSKGTQVVLSWTASSTGGSVIISRAVCPTASTCPATSGTAYTPLNQAAPATGTTFTDANPPAGALVSYIAQSTSGGLVSVPSAQSNNGVPLAIPTLPLPPTSLGGAQQSAMLAPALESGPRTPLVASVNLPQPIQLTAVVRR